MKVASVSSLSVSVSLREKHRLYLSGLEKDKEQVHLKYVFNREKFPGSIYTGGHFPKSMLGVEAIKMFSANQNSSPECIYKYHSLTPLVL